MGHTSSELLLAIEHGEGVAKVRRDAGGRHSLSATDEYGGSRMTERRIAFAGLRDGWVQAGFLPAAATRVRARDAHGTWVDAAVGNGVWLAITPAQPLAVRFEDASGGIVPRPLDALEREAVTDATAPCTACDATEWDRALLTPVHTAAVVCRRCGHQVHMGTWYGSPGDGSKLDPQPPDDWWRERAETMRHVFAAARFPVYGLAAWEGKRAWRGHGDGIRGVDHISLGHEGGREVVVDTTRAEFAESHARLLERALEQLATPAISDEAWQRLSPAALTVELEQRQLRAGERVAAVVLQDLTIKVDGRPRRFRAGRLGDSWAAVATLDAVTVVVTADGIPPDAVALQRVTEIEPYLEPPAG